jgi:signal transduction histidine kinase
MLAIGIPAPGSQAEQVAFWLFLLALGCVPLSYWLGLLRNRLAYAGVADLVRGLRHVAPRGELRDVLARSLGDPSLDVAYWVPEQGRYVDVSGRPTTLPDGGEDRATTVVEHDGRPVAALLHDPALLADPALVDAVCAAAGLALENERLAAELRARLEELAASRSRLVQAADAERRRIERNLHDGAQQRLVSVSMALGLADAKLADDPAAARRMLAEARAGLGSAMEELRGLSQGIHPAVLTERGLAVALRELALTATLPVTLDCALGRRLPAPVEAAAYYVVAEALANIGKHAGATAVSVDVRERAGHAVVTVTDDGAGGADPAGGSGLRGLADRLATLDGRLEVRSPRGGGTTLRAELPCASS